MATFAKSSFNAAIYAAARPTYSPKLFEYIHEYYKNQPLGSSARWDRAVDVGCGTGQAASHLDGVFKEVVCVDPSAGMLDKAREFLLNKPRSTLGQASTRTSATDATANTKFTFAQGSAEDIPSTQEGSVDLLIAAQACHWFDWQKVWPEAKRVLRPQGGVAAFWVYGESRLSSFPSLTPRITEFWQGTDRGSTTSVGAYFQRPGRTVLERLLVDVPAPSVVLPGDVGLVDFQRLYFTDDRRDIPDISLTDAPQIVHPTIMKVDWRWIDVLGYLRTSSALHSYHEAFPEDKKHSDDTRFLERDLADIEVRGNEIVDPSMVGGGDIAVRFWKDLREGVQNELGQGAGLFDKVMVEWPVAMLLVRRG
ncbi:hypothetical protein D9611_009091 [Ephemerocybe angulata]|uniref:Methyltransferase type 11 domain-containing protein n=1 Tax=Ephemerocybe angulata TaxID=980116 RepID=A0A8H5CE43_9AGAR|nr:hypothetical protein D9611_009091 [Tulosesus angulatus]